MSLQDALLVGGKVQAAPGYADHVRFTDAAACEHCGARTCVEICSGQAITPGAGAVPAFDREKCVHCGACLWNCPAGAIRFEAGAGGLHSAQN
jgi:electron-transferring-flavoprotein dehydrogenase